MGINFSSLHVIEMTFIVCEDSPQVDSETCHIIQFISGNCLLSKIPRTKGRRGYINRANVCNNNKDHSTAACEQNSAAKVTHESA